MLTKREFSNETIIHFIGHGFKRPNGGIVKLAPRSSNTGLIDTLVSWDDLVRLFNGVANRCPQLYVNLGTVCYSDGILIVDSGRDFGYLVTNREVGDPVIPRKANKQFVELFHGQRNQYSDVGSNFRFVSS